jgi:tetratricopeptide (TPR) repeat protein
MLQKEFIEAEQLLDKAKVCAQNGDVNRALYLAQQAVQKYDGCEEAWLLIGKLSFHVDQRIHALEKVHAINPANTQTTILLEEARRLRDDPLGAAASYEQRGDFDEALRVYNELASRTKNSRDFDQIYKQIIRIESLRNEKISYVAPRTSIIRLTVGWPLLYLFLILIQVGLNPFAHPSFVLWFGLPLVAVGSFLLSITTIRSRHAFWQIIFAEEGEGSRFARLITATAGWLFVIFPHLFLLLDSMHRLRVFRIPPEPFH